MQIRKVSISLATFKHWVSRGYNLKKPWVVSSCYFMLLITKNRKLYNFQHINTIINSAKYEDFSNSTISVNRANFSNSAKYENSANSANFANSANLATLIYIFKEHRSNSIYISNMSHYESLNQNEWTNYTLYK